MMKDYHKGGEYMWEDLSKPWQRAFELAWESFKNDDVPVGAVITDSEGEIIAEGRNIMLDKKSSDPLAGTFMGHAGMIAMMQLKVDEHPDIRSYALYTTMEPCPMCLGTMLMMHIQDVRFAARDRFSGASGLKGKNKYTKKKRMIIEGGYKELESFQLMMHSSFEYRRERSRMEDMLDTWKEADTKAIEVGKQLFDEDYFTEAISDDKDIGTIYDEIISKYHDFNKWIQK